MESRHLAAAKELAKMYSDMVEGGTANLPSELPTAMKARALATCKRRLEEMNALIAKIESGEWTPESVIGK